jgi:hypothetical protein
LKIFVFFSSFVHREKKKTMKKEKKEKKWSKLGTAIRKRMEFKD